jgi:aconitase A
VWLASPATVAASAIAGELMSFEDLRRRHGGPRIAPGLHGAL